MRSSKYLAILADKVFNYLNLEPIQLGARGSYYGRNIIASYISQTEIILKVEETMMEYCILGSGFTLWDILYDHMFRMHLPKGEQNLMSVSTTATLKIIEWKETRRFQLVLAKKPKIIEALTGLMPNIEGPPI